MVVVMPLIIADADAGSSAGRMMTAMPRLFIAVPLEGEPPAPLAQVLQRLRAIGRPVKMAEPGPLHVTVAFLGDVDGAITPDLTEAMRETAAGVAAASTVQLRGLGAFPDIRRPSVVWCGMADVAWMVDLEARLRPWLDALGLPLDDRPFHPHVTLARMSLRDRRDRVPGALAELLQQHADTDFGAAAIGGLCLIQSELTPKGAIHTTIETVRLKGDG